MGKERKEELRGRGFKPANWMCVGEERGMGGGSWGNKMRGRRKWREKS